MSAEDDGKRRSPDRQADGYNAGYAEELAEGELRRRGLVPPSLADWMEEGDRGRRAEVLERASAASPAPAASTASGVRPAAAPEAPSAERLRAAAIAGAIVEAHRNQGHLAVQLDPLGSEPPGHPTLDPRFYEIEESALEDLPAAALGLERLGEDVGNVLDRLREIYCGHIGYELDYMEDPAQRDWLVDYIESGQHRKELSAEEKRALLEELTRVDGLENFLHRSYLGKKRFSAEGLDMMIPMLREVAHRSADRDVREILIGMAHRGRLNVLAHVVGRDYAEILAEFEGDEERGLQAAVADVGAGDVKYHVGARGAMDTPAGRVAVSLAPNPSHLEHVNPVVEGMARAARERWERGERAAELGLEATDADGDLDLAVDGPRPHGGGRRTLDGGPDAPGGGVLPILIHGDAAFMGQGIAAETLNLSRLRAYETGGTIHFIANNQLGFTTRPEDGRSTRYASDLALGFRIPVIHVNADDPEACLAAVRLAVDYRSEFGEDIVVDLVGYRRYGHNEGDEPGYTQPAMYERIDDHPTVRAQFASSLVEEGVVSQEEADELSDRLADELRDVQEKVQSDEEQESGETGTPDDDHEPGTPQGNGLTLIQDPAEVDTTVDRDRLLDLNQGLHTWPDDFQLFQKLDRQLSKRREGFEEEGEMDWAFAEALAFGSLVTDGVPVRLSGEDSERGTFSQRHLVLHDTEGRQTYTPLCHLSEDQAPFQIWNSPLSEPAAIGFEYGYSTIATDSLVLWEAQFGDFVNVGQAILDQFVVSGRTKWGQESRLTLLLPHGYEGQGPEHSSGRPERFLQLAAEENIRVANCSTPAQYFHLLRLQALREDRRPLVVFTPKSLLRHPRARSRIEELSEGRFRPVLPDPERQGGGDDSPVRRAVLCTGKVFYDLLTSDAREGSDEVALIRVERAYPFPEEEIAGALSDHPGLEEVIWLQEEPKNMGWWSYMEPRLRTVLEESGLDVTLDHVGRPPMASPAEGFASAHEEEQSRIVEAAFSS